jgi:hypothetical protein
MASTWPFDAPPNVTALVSRHVLQGEPICHVYRDWDDGMWQFLPGLVTEVSDGKIVCLKEVFKHDPSIAALADLPPGWMATRIDRESAWQRLKNHSFPVFADDGFYLDDATEYDRLFPDDCRIPSEDIRQNLCAGDSVKLIFRFADERSPRCDNECERMWVQVIEADDENERYRGELLNEPLLHPQIAAGHLLWFHPCHVFAKHEE